MKLAAFSNFSHMFFPSSFKQKILQKIFEMDEKIDAYEEKNIQKKH